MDGLIIGQGKPRKVKELFHVDSWTRQKYAREFRTAFDSIDSVHEISSLPLSTPIPIQLTNSPDDNGVYCFDGGTGIPTKIEISRKGETPAFTLIHEIGHFLENIAIPGSEFGVRLWETDKILRGWREAVLTSGPAKILFAIKTSGFVQIKKIDGSFESRPTSRAFMDYICSNDEFWGRSYAQYVATRSGCQFLEKQLNFRTSPIAVYPLQWTSDEFEPIALEFDTLFSEMGWRP